MLSQVLSGILKIVCKIYDAVIKSAQNPSISFFITHI